MMRCSYCDREFKNGDEVTAEIPGVIIKGEFKQAEEESVHHVECYS